METADSRAFAHYISSRREIQNGAFSYGDKALKHILPLVQGITLGVKSAPVVTVNSKWRGFFRLGLWEEERALLEFGYPGPRIKRFLPSEWKVLLSCCQLASSGEWVIIVSKKRQVPVVQELVDLGYLVISNER